MTYPVPANQVETLYEVKKSKFIACAAYTNSRDDAKALLDSVKQRYPDARHHCWAYVIGNPNSPVCAAMADDGEPSGTAGKPIFNVLQHKNIGDIMIIVTRYFGGIKLGAGGLVRAYSSAAQQAIDALEIRHDVKFENFNIATDFKHEQFIRHLVEQAGGKIARCDYSQEVTMQIQLPASQTEEFNEKVASVTSNVTER